MKTPALKSLYDEVKERRHTIYPAETDQFRLWADLEEWLDSELYCRQHNYLMGKTNERQYP